jgi:hypothetical protein
MSEPQPAACPACHGPVDLMKIAAMSSSDRYICPHCKASLQRTSPSGDDINFVTVMLAVVIAQFARFSLWLLLLIPLFFLARHQLLKRRLPETTFKLAEPWSVRA